MKPSLWMLRRLLPQAIRTWHPRASPRRLHPSAVARPRLRKRVTAPIGDVGAAAAPLITAFGSAVQGTETGDPNWDSNAVLVDPAKF